MANASANATANANLPAEVGHQLKRAHKKIADLLEDIGRLSDELQRKDSLLTTLKSRLPALTSWLETTQTGELQHHNTIAALRDTVIWEPSSSSGQRPSCSTPNGGALWSEVVVRSRKRAPGGAPGRAPCGVSPSIGINLTNKFSALSMSSEPAVLGPADPDVSQLTDAVPRLTDTTAFPPLRPASDHRDRRPAPDRAVTGRSPPSSRPSSQRKRLLRDAVRWHTRSPHLRAPDGDGGVAEPAAHPGQLATTLLIGDSLIRNVRLRGASTLCFPGATVSDITEKIPDVLTSHPQETLDSFALVDAELLGRVFSQVKPTTCLLDPIPTSLFKSLYGFLEVELLNMVNCSLQTGCFPADLKTAVVRPLLKKNNLDPDVFNNYRPVSNLPFLSKILEKIVFIQLNDFLYKHSILEKFQSGFRTNHSTETALLKIVNDFRCNLDLHKLTVLVLLDLSAAFDTVDHTILLNRLRHHVGLSGTAFQWFSSYLTDRKFLVSLDTCSSRTHEVKCGVPQGSILGPILFNIYMLPLGDVIRRHGIMFHSYADDTQLYISMSPDDTGPIDALFNCILDIKSWMAENFLQLNQGKTEVLIIDPKAQGEKLFSKLQTLSLTPCNQVKNLGVIFDSELNFIPHIKSVTKTGFYHLKNIARVRPFLSRANTETLMHAFISSRIDYCNALLSGLPKRNISSLQLLQNSAARVLTKTRRRAHITPVLKSLHWLPVCFRIDFKVLLMVFKCLRGLGPSYLSELLLPYEPSRTLRSSGTGLLIIPKARTRTYGEASFQHYGPRLWNSLPEDLRAAENVHIFKSRLKTHLFNLAFN
ncbi:uncharacterized protein LOC141796151 [Halichoeres trimaculatus]|uniref:uncharacterized protein LOC141796151 n=1 Tax=Halichoeres trimaculatus TaxID=147232 RepID=UPI003D9E5BDF